MLRVAVVVEHRKMLSKQSVFFNKDLSGNKRTAPYI